MHPVAGDEVAGLDLAEGGHLGGALLGGIGAAGAEGTAGGGVQGAGNIAGQDDTLVGAGDLGIGHGHSGQQRLGVGVHG